MSTITIVYGIKFTLRGEELARQKDITQCCGINITYFNNESTNASMMSFELNESDALDRAFVTLLELAKRRNFTNVDLYDVDLYANDTVEIVRAVEEEEDEVYMILGQKGTDPCNPTTHAKLTDPTDTANCAGHRNFLCSTDPIDSFHPAAHV
jgi:hypothetical protein